MSAAGLVPYQLFGPVVEGMVKSIQPVPGCSLVQVPVAGDHGFVADVRDQGGMIRFPVGIDQQPGKARQDGRRIQRLRHLAGNFRHADIPGDMALQVRPAQAEVVEFLRYEVAGMLADQHNIGFSLGIEDFIGLGLFRGGGVFAGCLLHVSFVFRITLVTKVCSRPVKSSQGVEPASKGVIRTVKL